MRIIGQNFMDIPYDQVLICVDDERILCRPLSRVNDSVFALGEYESNKRTVEVFEKIIKAGQDKCPVFRMPEE